MADSANTAQSLLLQFLDLFSSSGSWSVWLQEIGGLWVMIRRNVLAPILDVMVTLCLIMSVMLIAEKLLMGAVSLLAKVFKWRPANRYKWEPVRVDEELGNSAYPMVLVQVPMYNEKHVYELSIGAACRLIWPADRMIIQVLDDSTDPEIKDLVEKECKKWASTGVNIRYEVRGNRSGYKAGALREGMKHDYVDQCDFIAMFDADFQPDADFLVQLVPYLIHNPDIGLVQARWKFVNSHECIMTRVQEMSMDYHFKVEQESGSTMHSMFGFNGTAGVWRISAINEAGGWKDRTTVEDMDLAVRATLASWKFLYVGDIKVKSELPSSFKAYRYQQHRWSCGPANLLRKTAMEILTTKKVSIWKKIYLIYSFFIVRRILAHIVTFVFYCVVIPASVLVPEVNVPLWGVIYVPTIITLLNSVGTPRSFYLIPFWILFENVMAMHRTRAVIIGLLEVGEVNEWVVTEKQGDASKPNTVKQAPKQSKKKPTSRILLPELGMSVFLLVCATYDFMYAHNTYYFYIYPQSIAFFTIAVGFIGTYAPN